MKLWKAGLAVVGLLSVATAAASVGFFRFAIKRKPTTTADKKQVEVGMEWDRHMSRIADAGKWLGEQPVEKVSIRSFDGLWLRGVLLPAKASTGKVLLAFHGYTSTGSSYGCMARRFNERGYDVLLVDNRAHGESEGKYIGFGCLDRLDCKEWINWIIGRYGTDCSVVLHGTSMGGATVMMASGLQLPSNVKAIISDCGFTSAWDIFKHILRRDYHLPAFPLMYTTSAICKQLAGYGFRDCTSLEAVRKTQIPMLFIHGGKDDFVPTDMSRLAYEECASPIKRLFIVENAGHGASYYEDTPGYEGVMEEFLRDLSLL